MQRVIEKNIAKAIDTIKDEYELNGEIVTLCSEARDELGTIEIRLLTIIDGFMNEYNEKTKLFKDMVNKLRNDKQALDSERGKYEHRINTLEQSKEGTKKELERVLKEKEKCEAKIVVLTADVKDSRKKLRDRNKEYKILYNEKKEQIQTDKESYELLHRKYKALKSQLTDLPSDCLQSRCQYNFQVWEPLKHKVRMYNQR